MTTQERLKASAAYLRTQYPRPFCCGQFIDELMVQAANEMDNWIHLLAQAGLEAATAQGLRNPHPDQTSPMTVGREAFEEGDPGEP